ncbi:A-kinase anchor protein 17A [Spatholobus suberectus]|nr:A-kinase anchor protein 17A [Spatholobus suberectus]
MSEEKGEALKALEIENGLSLVPRVKLNLTVYPSTPLTLTHPIDEWKMKRALIDFLRSSHSLSLSLNEEDLQITRHKLLKKRKRDDPVAAGTLRIWDLSFLQTESRLLEWRNRLAENINGIQLNLEGAKFNLAVSVPVSDDFHSMKKDWEEHSAFRSRRQPDTVILRGVPSRWFAEPRVSSKPSMLVTHTIFSTFGNIRNLNVAKDDDFGKDANEDSGDLVSGLYCKIVVQFEKYRDFHDAMRVLCGRSLQKQGSRLKADYEVSWDKDGFFPEFKESNSREE